MGYFDGLWAEVNMLTGQSAKGSYRVLIDSPIQEEEFDDALKRGVEVTADQISSTEGLLTVNGRQVLLYIRDQGIRAISVLSGDRNSGTKFHVAECSTLESMRRQNRFPRYSAVHRFDGMFEIHGEGVPASTHTPKLAQLLVCQNCLKKLNYMSSALPSASPRQVARNFDINVFLETYSTIFSKAPRAVPMVDGDGEYTKDFKEISRKLRESRGWRCDKCEIRLRDYPALLHVHHINGVKHDNSCTNFRVLCLDCHRREPHHNHMRMSPGDMRTFLSLRRQQWRGRPLDWAGLLGLADLSLHGALSIAKSRGMKVPCLGAPENWGDTEILGVYWPTEKMMLTATELGGEAPPGWQVLGPDRFNEQYR